MSNLGAWAHLEGVLNAPVAADLFAKRHVFYAPFLGGAQANAAASTAAAKPTWLRIILAFWAGDRFWRPMCRILLASMPVLVERSFGERHMLLTLVLVTVADLLLQHY